VIEDEIHLVITTHVDGPVITAPESQSQSIRIQSPGWIPGRPYARSHGSGATTRDPGSLIHAAHHAKVELAMT
jgi:hypothetical protein